jgi:hypothetical protein
LGPGNWQGSSLLREARRRQVVANRHHQSGKCPNSPSSSCPSLTFLQSDASDLLKEGDEEFFFKAHGHKHTFQVKKAEDRAGWLAALGKKIIDAKAIKDEIHNSEGYKKHLETFGTFLIVDVIMAPIPKNLFTSTNALLAKVPAPAATTTPATSAAHEAKKSVDSAQATNSTNKNTAEAGGATEEKKDEEKTDKSRSQSRKRASFFAFLGKKEEKDEQKEAKSEEAKKEEVKEDKKEEAKATPEPGAAAGADVAAPAAAGKIFLFPVRSQLTIYSSGS